MNTKIVVQKKEAVRLAFWYPGVLLVVAVAFGATASSDPGRIGSHGLDNAVRGMTALSTLALALASLGYIKLKRCL